MVDPVVVFQNWLEEARAAGVREPTAMALATVDEHGAPAVRMVLLKHADERGFVFYTNLESDKGRQLAANGRAELCFHWAALEKQVRVHGAVQPVSAAEADAYFASRAHQSKLGAWASQQSRPLDRQVTLLKAVAKVAVRHPLKVPRPPHWSGFRVVSDWIELWSAGEFRLHDRVRYWREASAPDRWRAQRLYP